jgi:hypothetical protein
MSFPRENHRCSGQWGDALIDTPGSLIVGLTAALFFGGGAWRGPAPEQCGQLMRALAQSLVDCLDAT